MELKNGSRGSLSIGTGKRIISLRYAVCIPSEGPRQPSHSWHDDCKHKQTSSFLNPAQMNRQVCIRFLVNNLQYLPLHLPIRQIAGHHLYQNQQQTG